MNQEDLLKKIGGLKQLKPNKDFGAFSRNLILNGSAEPEVAELSKYFRLLKNLSPNTRYALESKLSILESAEKVTLRSIFAKRNTYAISLALATLLVIVGMNASSYFKSAVPQILSSASDNELIQEASTINRDINIHLDQINYYAVSASKSGVALKEASTDNKSKEIDGLLNQATF